VEATVHYSVVTNGEAGHRGLVPPTQCEERDGYRVTTPLRSLTAIAGSATSWPSLEPAVRDALHAEVVRRRQLLEAQLPKNAHARLVAAVDAAEVAERKAGA